MREGHRVELEPVERMIDPEVPCPRLALADEHRAIVEPGREDRGLPRRRDRLDDAEEVPVGVVGRLAAVVPDVVLVRPGRGEETHVARRRDGRRLAPATQLAADVRARVATGSGDLVEYRRMHPFDHVGGDAVEDDEDGLVRVVRWPRQGLPARRQQGQADDHTEEDAHWCVNIDASGRRHCGGHLGWRSWSRSGILRSPILRGN